MPLEGPCPLTLLVTYRGGDDVRVPLLDDRSTFVLRLDGPDGWIRRDQMAFPPPMGGPSMRPLRRGESMAGVAYLHDHFSRLTQGKSTLQMTLVIWPEVAGKSERVIFAETLEVDLLAQGQESLGQRIGEVAAQVAIADPGTDRLRLYESVRSLSHRDLIPLFLRALADPPVPQFHLDAWHRLVELCETYSERQALVRYLARQGVSQDQIIFELWRQARVRLTDQEIVELRRAENLAIKLACLEYYPDRALTDGMIRSLENEIADLNGRFAALNPRSTGKHQAEASPPGLPGSDTPPAETGTLSPKAAPTEPRAWLLAGAGLGCFCLGVAAGFLISRGRVRRQVRRSHTAGG